MNKILKIILIVAVLLSAIGYGGYRYMIHKTKAFSPEQTVDYEKASYDLEVFYNRPYKKGREIFGSLVPFNKVWRTGANEATTFKTHSDLTIDGKSLKAGTYTLWTIPGAEFWKVIFNDKQYAWGVDKNGASRKAEFDVLVAEVPVEIQEEVVEQFTIRFEEKASQPILIMSWDQTQVSVPIQ